MAWPNKLHLPSKLNHAHHQPPLHQTIMVHGNPFVHEVGRAHTQKVVP